METVVATARTLELVVATPRERVVATARPRETVAAHAIDNIWVRHHWKPTSTARGYQIYEGPFHALLRRTGEVKEFPGRIEVGAGTTNAYVRRPPRGLLTRHPKRACFSEAADGWYRMNWYRGSRDVDETICVMERTLDEALNESWEP
jgi:hypothetical protein